MVETKQISNRWMVASRQADVRNDLKTLRALTHDRRPGGIRAFLVLLLRNVLSICHSINFIGTGTSNNMCKNYGHVLPSPRSSPKVTYSYKICCDDCGKEITSPKELRRANLIVTELSDR